MRCLIFLAVLPQNSDSFSVYLVKLVKQTCFTNAAGGWRFDIAVVRSYCWSILNRIISTRWTGSRWKWKLLMYDSCFISSINVWLPTFGTRLKNKISITALFVLFNWSALGMIASGTRVDRCCNTQKKEKKYIYRTHNHTNWTRSNAKIKWMKWIKSNRMNGMNENYRKIRLNINNKTE